VGGRNSNLYCENQRILLARGMESKLARFGLKGKRVDHILRELVAQTLTELTALYDVRHAAL